MTLSRIFRSALILLIPLSALFSSGNCWGDLGHRTVAYLAQHYLSPDAVSFTADLLGEEEFSDAALWADSFRRTPQGRLTESWHYIDAKDDPPRDCGVRYSRDCDSKVGCVVSAIVNMTGRINDMSLPPDQHTQALKFLMHFIGDIHQPLHTENEARGGNSIPVLFEESHKNLHGIWDTEIPVKHNGGPHRDERALAAAWADRLFKGQSDVAGQGRHAEQLHINSPVGIQEDTTHCVDVTRSEECALEWAGEANSWICKYVLKDDVEAVKDKELSGDYYEGAVPIVDELIAKAGVRLAAWLNGLANVRARMSLEDQEL